MFKRILVATDLSEASEQVVGNLDGLRRLGSIEAVLVHCQNLRDVGTLAESLEEEIRPILDRQRRTLEEQGFAVTTELVLGLPHIEINRLGEERDCGVIVVGSHGQSLPGEMLVGSVASAVIHSAVRPVLLYRLIFLKEKKTLACPVPGCRLLDHVLFPTDFSENAERAFDYVCKAVESGARRVTLLHVQDESRIGKYLHDRLEEFNAEDFKRLIALKERLETHGDAEVSVELPYGSPIREILRVARESGVSWIILGSQGRGFLQEIFLGSVSHQTARHAPTPVLLVPMRRD